MNAPSNAAPGNLAPTGSAPAMISPMRLLAWCVRRELWENRSLYIAPLLVAGLVLIGHIISLARNSENILGLTPAALTTTKVMLPYSAAAAIIIAIVVIVGWFYCLDALHGERRDRSILFWKSLPVSDRITVLSKAAIPFAVMPVFAFVIITALQAVMLLTSTLVLMMKGASLEAYWASLTIGKMSVGLAYALVTLPLWHAPVTAWLLLVSAWAQRVPFLWAVLPPIVLCVTERIAFGGKHLFDAVTSRIGGHFSHAFTPNVQAGVDGSSAAVVLGKSKPMADVVPDPMKFFTNPDLWIGLAIAFVLIAACVRLRRQREPI